MKMLSKKFFSILIKCDRYKKSNYLFENFKIYNKISLLNKSLSTAPPEAKNISNFPNPFDRRRIESYIHEYLLKRPEYYTSIYDINCLNSVNDSDPESLKLLGRLINDTSVDSTFKEKLKESFKCELNFFDIKQICKAICFLSQLNISCERTLYNSLLGILENQLQIRHFSSEDYLKLQYVIKKTWTDRNSYVNFLKQKACVKLLLKLHQLNPQQVTEFFFCISKKLEKFEFKYPVLSKVNDFVPQFNSNELGIVAFGLLGCNISNSHREIEYSFMRKTLQEVENIHQYSLYMILRVLKKFFIPPNVEHLLDFQKKMIPHFSKFDPQIIISLGLIGIEFRVLNSSFWENSVKIFKEKIQDLNLSDITRLLKIQVECNIYDEDFLNLVVKNLESIEILKNNYINLLFILSYLTHFKLFPKKLLDIILTDDFTSRLVKKNSSHSSRFNLWYLKCCVELEKPEYQYNIFHSVSRSKFYRFTYHPPSNEKVMKFNSFFFKVKDTLVKIFGDDMVYHTNCVPYFEFGCVLRFNEDLNSQPIPEDFKLAEKYYAQEAHKDGCFWIFLMCWNKSDFLWNSETICLSKQTQLRHLNLIGFTPVVVKQNDFFEQFNVQKEENYLRELVNETLKQIKITKPKFL